MKPVRINVEQIPDELQAGVRELCNWEGFSVSQDGIRICAQRAQAFSVRRDAHRLDVQYCEPVQFFRALSFLKMPEQEDVLVDRQPAFEHNGVMLDCSRNGVLKVDTVKVFVRKMALMGLNTLMLYTEDTYELPQRPYFGYLRGRYTAAQLREMDDYAAAFGVEMIPCIQTLAHLERALHWPQVDPALRDTDDILMVGEEKTYQLIEEMICAASEPLRSKRIHIGMDEAWSLGLGNFRFQNGVVPSAQLMKRHLSRVCEITRKNGLEPMMWSDMYLRAASPTGNYYDAPDTMPDDVLSAAPRDVSLVYWDYYHERQSVYERMLKIHAQFDAPTVFAGGLWTWSGPAPSTDKMRASSIPALQACAESGTRFVFATAWGDNGAETNLLTALYGMQLYAEYDYTGQTAQDQIDKRFEACVGEPAAAFAQLYRFNVPNGICPKEEAPMNAAKFLLYEDPLLPLFTADTAGMSFVDHYAQLAQTYRAFHSDVPAMEALYRFYECLADLLEYKCRWRECAPQTTADSALSAALLAEQCAERAKRCKSAWQTLWTQTCKPYGFEVIDQRLSGLIGRFETAAEQMRKLERGEDDLLEPLFAPKLRYLTDEEGRFSTGPAWDACISACRI